MLGKAVYCQCKNNPNCKYCFGRGAFYVPYNTNNSFTNENMEIKNKPNSYEERFLMSHERILPECFKVWISDKQIESRPFELLSIRDSDESISLRTKFTTVDSAIKTAHMEIEDRIDVWYAFDKLRNKKYNIKLELSNIEHGVVLGWFKKKETCDLDFLQCLINFFKKEFMNDNL